VCIGYTLSTSTEEKTMAYSTPQKGIRVRLKLYEQLQLVAKQEERSVTSMINILLTKALSQYVTKTEVT